MDQQQYDKNIVQPPRSLIYFSSDSVAVRIGYRTAAVLSQFFYNINISMAGSSLDFMWVLHSCGNRNILPHKSKQ